MPPVVWSRRGTFVKAQADAARLAPTQSKHGSTDAHRQRISTGAHFADDFDALAGYKTNFEQPPSDQRAVMIARQIPSRFGCGRFEHLHDHAPGPGMEIGKTDDSANMSSR